MMLHVSIRGREFLKNLKQNEQTYMRSLLSLCWES